jgi:hypothetical protein
MDKDPDQFSLFEEEPIEPPFRHKKPEPKADVGFSESEKLNHLKRAKYFADEARLHGAAGSRRQVEEAYLSALNIGKTESEALAFREEALDTPPGPGTNTSKREIISRSDESITESIQEKILGCLACNEITCPWRTTSSVEYDELVSMMVANKKNGIKLIENLEEDSSRVCPEILGYSDKTD